MLPTLPASCRRSSTTRRHVAAQRRGRAAARSAQPMRGRRLQRAQLAEQRVGQHQHAPRLLRPAPRSAGCAQADSAISTCCSGQAARQRRRAQVVAFEPQQRRPCAIGAGSRCAAGARSTSSGLSRERDRAAASLVMARSPAPTRTGAKLRRCSAQAPCARSACRCSARRVALVRGEAVLRIALVQLQAQPVAVHLGQDRRRRDRLHLGIALDDGLRRHRPAPAAGCRRPARSAAAGAGLRPRGASPAAWPAGCSARSISSTLASATQQHSALARISSYSRSRRRGDQHLRVGQALDRLAARRGSPPRPPPGRPAGRGRPRRRRPPGPGRASPGPAAQASRTCAIASVARRAVSRRSSRCSSVKRAASRARAGGVVEPAPARRRPAPRAGRRPAAARARRTRGTGCWAGRPRAGSCMRFISCQLSAVHAVADDHRPLEQRRLQRGRAAGDQRHVAGRQRRRASGRRAAAAARRAHAARAAARAPRAAPAPPAARSAAPAAAGAAARRPAGTAARCGCDLARAGCPAAARPPHRRRARPSAGAAGGARQLQRDHVGQRMADIGGGDAVRARSSSGSNGNRHSTWSTLRAIVLDAPAAPGPDRRADEVDRADAGAPSAALRGRG